MMLTDEELDKFKKSNTFKMLVKGSYLGVMEYNFKNMTKKQLVDECFKREAQIFDLKNQLALTEKALEFACRELDNVEVFDAMFCECDSFYEYYLNRAKEMMKSE